MYTEIMLERERERERERRYLINISHYNIQQQ